VIYLLVYVDDILIAAQKLESAKKMTAELARRFEIKDLGDADKFLGMEIVRDLL
jgi:hypothetical protein